MIPTTIFRAVLYFSAHLYNVVFGYQVNMDFNTMNPTLTFDKFVTFVITDGNWDINCTQGKYRSKQLTVIVFLAHNNMCTQNTTVYFVSPVVSFSQCWQSCRCLQYKLLNFFKTINNHMAIITHNNIQ